MAAPADEYNRLVTTQERIYRAPGEGPSPVTKRLVWKVAVLGNNHEDLLGRIDEKNYVKTRLIANELTTFPSSIDLEITIGWEADGFARTTVQVVKFWSGNLERKPQYYYLNEELEQAIRTVGDKDLIEGLEKQELSIARITFNDKAARWTTNFRTGANYGKTAPLVKRLERNVSRGLIEMLIHHPSDTPSKHRLSVSHVADCIMEQKEESAMARWKRSPTEDRNKQLSPQVSFPTFEHYSSILREAFQAELDVERGYEGVTRELQAWFYKATEPDDKILVVAQFEKDEQLSAGELVRVSFDDHKYAYKANVIGAIDRQSISYTCFEIIITPKTGREAKMKHDEFPKWVKPETFDSFALQSIPETFYDTASVLINVSRSISTVSFERQSNALSNIHHGRDYTFEIMRRFLCGNDVGSIPRYNMFANLHSTDPNETTDTLVDSVLDTFKLSANQREIITAMKSCIGGWVAALGAPGVGKTTTFLTVISIILRCTIVNAPARMIFHAPSNTVVNRLIQSVASQILPTLPEGKPAMITRFYNDPDENKFAREYAERCASQRLVCYVEGGLRLGGTIIGLFHAVVQGKDLFEDSNITPKDVGDRKFSVYQHMAEAAGLITSHFNCHKEFLSELTWFQNMMKAYTDFAEDIHLQPKQVEDLILGLEKLQRYVLRKSDLIGLTSNLTGHKTISSAKINPFLVIGDEQAKQTDADIWVVCDAFPKAYFLNAGDPYQLPPTVKTIKTCGYACQFETSLLHRLTMFGGTAIRIREQRRATKDIAEIVERFYPAGFYITPADSPMESHRKLELVRSIFKNLFKVDKTTVILEVVDGQEGHPLNSTSWHNDATMDVTNAVLTALAGRLPTSDFGSVTMYSKQAARTDLALARRMAAVGRAGASSILQGTTEKIQGDERLVMVMDVVRGGRVLGHLADERRVGAAVSRARLGLVVVLDGKIKAAPAWRDGSLTLARVYADAKKEGRVLQVRAARYAATA